MSERMSDEEFLLLEDGIEDNERPDSAATVVLQEARRAREAESQSADALVACIDYIKWRPPGHGRRDKALVKALKALGYDSLNDFRRARLEKPSDAVGSERMSDEEFTARLDKDLCGRGEHWCAAEARRARYEEERLRGELARERSSWDLILEETRRLREKLERVAANRAELVEDVASAVAERDAERARVRYLKGVLIRLEWSRDDQRRCPACLGVEGEGHSPTCWLAAVLRGGEYEW